MARKFPAIVTLLAAFSIVSTSSMFSMASMSAQTPRTIEIKTADDMKFSIVTIKAKRGEQLRVKLVAAGAMPKAAMAHNFVLLKLGENPTTFAEKSMLARDTDFIAPELKNKVLAKTGLAGAGETVEVTFKVPNAAGSYDYICTFPGHFLMGMKGKLIVQ